jgi:hypothetical protein
MPADGSWDSFLFFPYRCAKITYYLLVSVKHNYHDKQTIANKSVYYSSYRPDDGRIRPKHVVKDIDALLFR